MTKDEIDLLTQVGPVTPCGELMRRYWQPAALSEELPLGGAPKAVRLLGEDLVLFRDDAGNIALLGLHCSHRGADLSYGRVEDGGLRCVYHGWLYDIHGRCLDQPGESHGGEHRDSIQHPAYPCKERAGVIFTYMGPGEPPLFPNYEFLSVPDEQVSAVKLFHGCNYLQANEGNIDLLHLSFLHYSSLSRRRGEGPPPNEELSRRGGAPEGESADGELTGYGVRSYKFTRSLGIQGYLFEITEFVLPNFTAFSGGVRGGEGYSVNWHVPIDDTQHWKYTFTFRRRAPVDKESARRSRAEMTPDYKSIRNKTNRYLQDRNSMTQESYTGIGFNFQIHDLYATEGQGPIQDRTKEHLTPMDIAIVVARKLMAKAIRDIQEGKEPSNVVREAKLNHFPIVAFKGVLPHEKDWRERVRELEEEICPTS